MLPETFIQLLLSLIVYNISGNGLLLELDFLWKEDC
nr:MAG TPA: hypothetical protein [Caudoviricetes sp.]